MKVSHTLRASVFAFAAVLAAPALAFDIGALRPDGDDAAPVAVVGTPDVAAPVLGSAEADGTLPEEKGDTLKVVAAAVTEPVEAAAEEVVPAVTVPALVAPVVAEPVVADPVAAPPAAAVPPALPVEVVPPPLPQLPAYYAGIDGQPVGPLDEAALRELIASGKVTGETLVWTEGMADWIKAAEAADLEALLEEAPKSAALGTGKDEGKAVAKTPVVTPVVAPAPATSSVAAALPGTWEIDGMIPVDGLGMGDAEILQVFNPDGTYTANGTIIAVVPSLGSLPVEIVVSTAGRWTVTEGPNGQGEVTVIATTYVSIPSMGVPVQVNTGTDSFLVQVVDGETLIVDGTEWERITA
jgi:hypothetical protein